MDSYPRNSLASEIINLCKGINPLSTLVRNSHKHSSFKNALFIFDSPIRPEFWINCPLQQTIKKRSEKKLSLREFSISE